MGTCKLGLLYRLLAQWQLFTYYFAFGKLYETKPFRMAQPQPAAAAAVAAEMELCRQVIQAHRKSVVKIDVSQQDQQRVNSGHGTGFIVHMDPKFCLVMTCGHVLRDHIPGSISVSFGSISIKASVVLCDEDREVGLVRVDASSDPQRFGSIVNYPRVHWSDVEAGPKPLVAILARTADAEGYVCNSPSVFHGYIQLATRLAPPRTGKMPLHHGTADYTSVPGNSGSAIFNQQCRVVGIHISGVAQMSNFVCLAGVALVMTEYLVRKGLMVMPSGGCGTNVAGLLNQIIISESQVGGPVGGAGPSSSSSSSSAGAGPSSSAR